MTTEQKFKKALFASENKLLIKLYLDFESDLDKGQKEIISKLQQQVKKLNIADVSKPMSDEKKETYKKFILMRKHKQRWNMF